MKKIMALVLAVVMVLGSVCLVNAAVEPFQAGEAIAEIGARLHDQSAEVEVPVSGSVKKSTQENYVAGPITIATDSDVDVKATVDMSVVQEKIANYYTTIKLMGTEGTYAMNRGWVVEETSPDAAAAAAAKEAFMAEIESLVATGSFTFSIEYPSTVAVPATTLNGTDLDGFDSSVATLFHETNRTIEEVEREGKTYRKFTITVELNDTIKNVIVDEDGVVTLEDTGKVVTFGELYANKEALLPNFSFVSENNTITRSDSYSFAGNIEGTITVAALGGEITFVSDATPTVFIAERKTSSGGGGGSTVVNKPIKINVDGKEVEVKADRLGKYVLDVDKLEAPTKEYHKFAGWTLDAEGETAVAGLIEVTAETVLYAQFEIDVDADEAFILTIGELEANVFGEIKENDVAPMIKNDRTMLPARFVAENLGATVEWNEEERDVTITKEDTVIVITIDSEVATVNGEDVILDSPAFIQDDRTFTPIRFISENLGATVLWDAENYKVYIIK